MTHEEAAALAERHFIEGLDLLRASAALLRGMAIQPSAEAMRTETVLTRAIEALVSTGFSAPRKA